MTTDLGEAGPSLALNPECTRQRDVMNPLLSAGEKLMAIA